MSQGVDPSKRSRHASGSHSGGSSGSDLNLVLGSRGGRRGGGLLLGVGGVLAGVLGLDSGGLLGGLLALAEVEAPEQGCERLDEGLETAACGLGLLLLGVRVGGLGQLLVLLLRLGRLGLLDDDGRDLGLLLLGLGLEGRLGDLLLLLLLRHGEGCGVGRGDCWE
ncbi:hypothetical protein B0T26DRAFT_710426 [Lasiosphaeria miniovina]|uniref:Uncharacterized protein n=1 Tax=Lasiosphaeria miniovina TaxID=1954250 RepID=A0AA40AKV4_9PEZI|nr:uncharacterized protein B0T26DRAFT_710426 [Lasiosphaeria miniovina]KAK0717642.1 hypothetical protein B0T26DRAFT_710426 [Lasiosphaeria miniovina]